MTTFATQFLHHQYIKKTTPAYESFNWSPRTISVPRPLKAGLAWAAVFGALLTKITLSQKIVNDYSDPVIAVTSRKTMWEKASKKCA